LKLNVNIDHVATLRNARGGKSPDPVQAALAVERAGAHGITFHLREDRRHIRDEDVRRLAKVVKTKMNMEMAATAEMLEIAEAIRPEWATLVPEKRLELTTEGGLDVARHLPALRRAVARLQRAGVEVSLFVDPDPRQLRYAADTGATMVEIHTGRYADAPSGPARWARLREIRQAVEDAIRLGFWVNAGHGLNYVNVKPIARLPGLRELSIGHAIVAKAVEVGMVQAVREMLALLR